MACNKIKHSKTGAFMAAKQAWKQGQNVRPYPCRKCKGAWHVGHRQKMYKIWELLDQIKKDNGK